MSQLITTTRAQAVASLASLSQTALQSLISAASGLVEQYCRRQFAATSRSEVFSGDGTNSILVRVYPIISLTSITIKDCLGEEIAYAESDVDIDERIGEMRLKSPAVTQKYWGHYPWGFQNVTILYTGGFATIPEDVQEACLQLMLWINSNRTLNQNLESKQIGDYKETYRRYRGQASSDMDLPPIVRQLLAGYRTRGI